MGVWLGLEIALGDAERAFGHAGGAFVRLADVDQQRAMGEAFAGLGRSEFGDRAHAEDYRARALRQPK